MNQDSPAPAQPAQQPTAASNAPGAAAPQGEGNGESPKKLDVPYLNEAKEAMRGFCIADKQLRLYPVHSKVAQSALSSFVEVVRKFLDTAGQPLQLRVSKSCFLFDEDVEVYREDNAPKSLAHFVFKDGVRLITISEEVTREELTDFLACFREASEADDDDADFGTLFWEKDCTNIQLQLIDDAEEGEEDLPVEISTGHLFASGFDPKRFNVSPQEEARLKKDLTDRLSGSSDGDNAFELTDEELEGIRKLAEAEESYFAIYDFVDVLVEHMAENSSASSFEEVVRLIAEITGALIENLDFEHATNLVSKILQDQHAALSDSQRKKFREAVDKFCDKRTMGLVGTFLKENRRLPKNHAVFKFLKLLGPSAAPHVCELMDLSSHIPALSQVLVEVGAGSNKVLTRHLMGSNADVSQAMIFVIQQTQDNEKAMTNIAEALTHQVESVRRAAAKTILEHGTEKVGAFFLPLLEDPPLLGTALQFYAKVSYPDAFDALTSMIQGAGFHTLEQPKQILCFRALILADPQKGLDFISNSILKWRFCWNQKVRRRKAAALRSLVEHPDAGAAETLFRYAQFKRSPLSGVAAQTLRMREKHQKKSSQSQDRKATRSTPAKKKAEGKQTTREMQRV